MRNPLYHWTHLELKTAFGITKRLNPETAREIFDQCNDRLQNDPDMTAVGLMRHYNVETVCTTDDPVDDLHWHRAYAEKNADGKNPKMLPAWRPDKAMNIEKPEYVPTSTSWARRQVQHHAPWPTSSMPCSGATTSSTARVAACRTTASRSSMPSPTRMPKSVRYSPRR